MPSPSAANRRPRLLPPIAAWWAIGLVCAGPVGAEPRIDATRYQKVLSLYRDGQTQKALEELRALEEPLFEPKLLPRAELYTRAFTKALQGYRDPAGGRTAIVLHLHQGLERYPRAEWVRGDRAIELARSLLGSLADPAPAQQRFKLLFWNTLGFSLQTGEDPERAIECFAAALALEPGDRDALLGAGTVYERLGRYPLAIQTLQRLLALHPDDEEARLRLGLCQLRSGDLRGGLQSLAALRTESSALLTGYLSRLELARYFLETQQWEDARRLLREAQELAPSHSEAYLMEAYLLARTGERDGALARSLASIAPEPRAVRSTRWIYDRLQSYKARVYLERLRLSIGLDGARS